MASELEGIVCADRERGAGAPVGGGHDAQDGLAPVKGLLRGLFLSFWIWWVIWLAWRAL
jgi:hypothetical protein